MTPDETEQRLIAIETMLKQILGNQAYLETLLDPAARHIMEAHGGHSEYQIQCNAAEDARRATPAKSRIAK